MARRDPHQRICRDLDASSRRHQQRRVAWRHLSRRQQQRRDSRFQRMNFIERRFHASRVWKFSQRRTTMTTVNELKLKTAIRQAISSLGVNEGMRARAILQNALDDDQAKYGVWCTVSGGVTGFREAWMKSDGKIKVFSTHQAAQAEADKHYRTAMGNPYRTADFSYQALRLSAHDLR